MPLLRTVSIVSLGALLVCWIALVAHYSGEPLGEPVIVPSRPGPAPAGQAGTPLVARPFRFASNEDCRPCHREIYAEWAGDQHARSWFNRPLLAQDPKLTECNNCHAPQPILQVGIEALPVIRGERFEEGVGCIECHAAVDHVEGPLPSREAACNPRVNADFTRSRICHSCHEPHGSLSEWEASAWSRRGYTCQACHMPFVDAPSVTDGPLRRRRSHRMKSQRDLDFLRSTLRLQARVLADRRLELRLSNVGAGHNVPGEIFNREIFLKTVVLGPDGQVVSEQRESLKTVRRQMRATEPTTQLRSGEERHFVYELEGASGRIDVVLGYKFLLYMPDSSAVVIFRRELGFGR